MGEPLFRCKFTAIPHIFQDIYTYIHIHIYMYTGKRKRKGLEESNYVLSVFSHPDPA